MSKQTAVEWFFSELERMQYFIGNDMLEAYKQAKEMEKQHAIEFLEDYDSYVFRGGNVSAEEYYNRIFKD